MKTKTNRVPIIIIISVFMMLVSCGQKQDKVKKIMEDGVEVVLNHIEPYRIKGESGTVQLKKEFSIDTENEEMLEIGLTGIETFDVDSEGNIYLIQWASSEDYIFKFDPKGNFLTSFSRKGQGPGEIEWGALVRISPKGEIIAKDVAKSKIQVFGQDGKFLREIRMEKSYFPIPLENGKYLIFWGEDTPEWRKQYVGICNSQFEDIKTLDVFQYPNILNVKGPVNRGWLIFSASKDKIYTGNTERGYEIRVHDIEGNLLRKIRKDHKPMKVPEEYKKTYFERFPEGDPILENLYFADQWPAFRDFYAGDEGHLYVLTHEEGVNPGEYMYDIYNSDGAFIGRMSLVNNQRLQNESFAAQVKKDRLYSLQENESGYRELVVYRMMWE
jgi:hypothetical protein